MKYFHFHVPSSNIDFNHPIMAQQCEQIKDDGERCKKRVAQGCPYCFLHLKYKHFLCIKPSTIEQAGLGVFVCNIKENNDFIVYRKNQKICPFDGEVITKEVLDDRYGEYTAPYAIEIHNDMVEDGATKRGIGSIINHQPNARTNCRYSITRDNHAWIVATKDIKNNTELFVNYGSSYRFGERGVQFSTNYKKKTV